MAIKKVRMKPPGYTDIVHPETSADVVIEDASHRFVTDSEKGIWNAKQAAITGGATTITSSNLTASRALVSDASGKVTVSAVTSTQLGYLSGATGNIQTQMNLKLERNNDVGSGVGVGTLTIADANLLQGFPASTFARQSDLASANTKIGLGGIVESGSNANGRYIKYNDGTMICTFSVTLNVIGWTWANGDSVMKTLTFPSPFSSTDYSISITKKNTNTHLGWRTSGIVHARALSTVYLGMVSSSDAIFSSGNIIDVDCFAVGRWK